MTKNQFIKKAQKEIEQLGYSVTKKFNNKNECHLILIKNDKRRAWGMFNEFYCWSLAYEAITKKSFLNLN